MNEKMTGGSKTMELWNQIQTEAKEIESTEPLMSSLLRETILSDSIKTFEEAIAKTVSHHIIQSCGSRHTITNKIEKIILDSLKSNELEMGHTMLEAVKEDILSYKKDPACGSFLEVILFLKGFAALVCHRVAYRKWNGKKKERFTALWLQSQASAAFGVDIHPAASIGAGILLDHGTGIVIGETASIGDNCTLLHGVTLGSTGKTGGNRHPKVGNNVFIGAGSSILGNIKIGERAKIGAGTIVLKPIPPGTTAVGIPAKIIGWSKEFNPGNEVDTQLHHSIDNVKQKYFKTISTLLLFYYFLLVVRSRF